MSAYIEKADIRLAGYSYGANVAVLADCAASQVGCG